jgi:hypothetical protein
MSKPCIYDTYEMLKVLAHNRGQKITKRQRQMPG